MSSQRMYKSIILSKEDLIKRGVPLLTGEEGHLLSYEEIKTEKEEISKFYRSKFVSAYWSHTQNVDFSLSTDKITVLMAYDRMINPPKGITPIQL